MDWVTIQEDDLQCVLNKNQLDLLKAETIRSANASICVKIIELVVSRIRAEIAASGKNMLDENYAKIPMELKECALRLAMESLQTRIPSMELSESQKRAIDASREILRRVANGELPVSKPRNGVRTARKFSITHGSASRKITRKSTEGM